MKLLLKLFFFFVTTNAIGQQLVDSIVFDNTALQGKNIN